MLPFVRYDFCCYTVKEKGCCTMDGKIFETTIVLDDEKLKESPYSKEAVYQYLEKVFASVDMARKDATTFDNGTCALVGVALCALFKVEWFMKLVKEWTLSTREEGVITYTENVLESKAVKRKYLAQYGLI